MELINQEVIERIKKGNKKLLFFFVSSFLAFVLSIVLLFVFSSREYKQLCIFIFAFVFALLINFMIYNFDRIKKNRSEITLYQSVLLENKKQVQVVIKEDLNQETFLNVAFHAYRVEDSKGKIFRVLVHREHVLNIESGYVLFVFKGVVVRYEKTK